MTTENVAIMFTDIVGSTELSQRLSAESADEVRRIHFSILRRAVTEAGGAEVKTTGDGLMVVFGSASAALGCAVAMQQGVERNNRGSEHSVGLRIGLSIGEVSREDGDYFGDPAVEAARLCALCEGGQVLATKRAAGDRRSAQPLRVPIDRPTRAKGTFGPGRDSGGSVGAPGRLHRRRYYPAPWPSGNSTGYGCGRSCR